MSYEREPRDTMKPSKRRITGYRLLAGAMAAWLAWWGGRIILSGEYVFRTKRGATVHMEGIEAYALGLMFIGFGVLLLRVVFGQARRKGSAGERGSGA